MSNDPNTARAALVDDALGLLDQLEELMTNECRKPATWPQVGSLAEAVAKLSVARNFLAGEPPGK